MINGNLESVSEKSKEYLVSITFFGFKGESYIISGNMQGVVEEGQVKGDMHMVKIKAGFGDRLRIKINEYYFWIRVMSSDVTFCFGLSSVDILVKEIGGE
ncbi:MAG: hypothetical protein QXF15_03820 [Candidatus Aenigmatarchaeota archaeon]